MAVRAYVQPKVILGTIQYLQPGIEVISIDKQLIPIDSSLQALDPGINILKVFLPEEQYCEGMIFDIINTTSQNGILEIYDFSQANKIIEVKQGLKKQFICLNGVWQTYITFDISTNQGYPDEYEEIIFNPSMDHFEIEDTINSISKFIHPNKTISLKFENGIYEFLDMQLNNFYGGGVLNVQSSDPLCHAKLENSTGNGIDIYNNTDIEINISNMCLNYMGDNIVFINNRNTILNVYKCRITSPVQSHGIYSEHEKTPFPKFKQSNINIAQTQFGNLSNCVHSTGDFSILITNCSVALTETSNPQPMPNGFLCDINGGGKIVVDSVTETNIPNINMLRGTLFTGGAY